MLATLLIIVESVLFLLEAIIWDLRNNVLFRLRRKVCTELDLPAISMNIVLMQKVFSYHDEVMKDLLKDIQNKTS